MILQTRGDQYIIHTHTCQVMCVHTRGPLIDTRFCRVDSLKATRASNPKGPNTLNRDKTAISVLEKLLIVFSQRPPTRCGQFIF